MFQLIEKGGQPNTNIELYFCDTAADLVNLPESAPFGSIALILTTKVVKVKSSTGWVDF